MNIIKIVRTSILYINFSREKTDNHLKKMTKISFLTYTS